jgi:hypothetical protein
LLSSYSGPTSLVRQHSRSGWPASFALSYSFFPVCRRFTVFVYIFWRATSWPLKFAYVAHFVFMRDVWIRTQRAAVASRRATNLSAHLPILARVRAMAWLTGLVQGTLFGNWLLCLFSCTFPAPLVTRGLKAALLPPTPWVCPNLPFLFSSSGPLRSFPSVWIALEAGSRAGRRE